MKRRALLAGQNRGPLPQALSTPRLDSDAPSAEPAELCPSPMRPLRFGEATEAEGGAESAIETPSRDPAGERRDSPRLRSCKPDSEYTPQESGGKPDSEYLPQESRGKQNSEYPPQESGFSEALAAAPLEDLPPGWRCRQSRKWGRPFYYHKASGRTQWHPPTADEPQQSTTLC